MLNLMIKSQLLKLLLECPTKLKPWQPQTKSALAKKFRRMKLMITQSKEKNGLCRSATL